MCIQAKYFKGQYQDVDTFGTWPLQVAAEREIARMQFGIAGRTFDPDAWLVAVKGFPHPAFSADSLVAALLAPFLLAANMFGFVIVVRPNTLETNSIGVLRSMCLRHGLTLGSYLPYVLAQKILVKSFLWDDRESCAKEQRCLLGLLLQVS